MEVERIQTFNVADTHPELGLDLGLAQAVVAGGLVFLRGQVGQSTDNFTTVGLGDVTAQARQALKNASDLLVDAGSHLQHILKVNVYLLDINDRPAVYAVLGEQLAGVYPATTCLVVSAFTRPEFLVEFDIVAAVDRGSGT